MTNYLTIRRFIFVGILISIGLAHPFHVSITTFQVNPVSNNVEITLKLFTDDLEGAIGYEGLPPLHLGSKKEYQKSDSLIYRYINYNVKLLLNNTKPTLKWVGKEIEHDITWCYLEIENDGKIETVSITNSLFIANYIDQLNISHFYIGNQTETLMHYKDDVFGKFEIEPSTYSK